MEREKNVSLLDESAIRQALMFEGAFTILHKNNQRGFGEVERFLVLTSEQAHILLSFRSNQAPSLTTEEDQQIFPDQVYRREQEWIEYSTPIPTHPDRVTISVVDEGLYVESGLSCNIGHDGISRLGGFYSLQIKPAQRTIGVSLAGILGYETDQPHEESKESVQETINHLTRGKMNLLLTNLLEDHYTARGSIPIISHRSRANTPIERSVRNRFTGSHYMQYVSTGIRRALLAR